MRSAKAGVKTTAPQCDSPYCGLTGSGDRAGAGVVHVLASGPTGTGKTRRVLGPALATWDGPAISVSSKSDFADLTTPARRHHGPVRVLDLGGHVRLPADVGRVRYDPTDALSDPDDALDLAALLLRVSTVGAGHSTGDAFWTTLATPPLAALLWAAHANSTGSELDGIAAVAPAAGDLTSWPHFVTALDDDPTPGAERLLSALKSVAAMDDRMRSSVLATMQPAVAAWLRTAIAPARTEPRLDLDSLDAGTLHVIAPGTGLAAAAACALLAQVVGRWRRAVEAGKSRATILFAIDEIANTAPLPDLPTWVTEARGLGVRIAAATQSLSQLDLKWGRDAAAVLRDCFPAMLVLTGSPDHHLLERAATYAGTREIGSVTTDSAGRTTTRSTSDAARFRPESLAPSDVSHARLLVGGRDAGLVHLPDWSDLTKGN